MTTPINQYTSREPATILDLYELACRGGITPLEDTCLVALGPKAVHRYPDGRIYPATRAKWHCEQILGIIAELRSMPNLGDYKQHKPTIHARMGHVGNRIFSLACLAANELARLQDVERKISETRWRQR